MFSPKTTWLLIYWVYFYLLLNIHQTPCREEEDEGVETETEAGRASTGGRNPLAEYVTHEDKHIGVGHDVE